MADDGFHEIELRGKQLVFLFMAATVVSVVIFLCGVMVGRNLRLPEAEPALAAAAVDDPTVVASGLPSVSATTDSGTPVSAQETLTYAERLESASPVPETLRPSSPSRPAEAPDPPSEPVPAAEPAPRASSPDPTARNSETASRNSAPERSTPQSAAPQASARNKPAEAARTSPIEPALVEPKGDGWVVQVQAVNSKTDAEAIARRLARKGYPTFVSERTAPGARYRIRVGKFTDRREADSVGARLKKEEQFNVWITK